MSTKSSVLYDEETDIHIYHEMMDNKFYIECGDGKMKITGILAIEIEKKYNIMHGGE
jgi:hypothetical protein